MTSSKLSANELHVWHIQLPEQVCCSVQLTHPLNQAEKKRLESFSHPLMRQNYLLIRTILRRTLGNYLNCPPAQVKITTTNHNKPQLIPDTGSLNLQFNLSHSANRAVIAFALDTPLGIDLELSKKRRNIKALLRRYFSPRTQAEIEKLPPAARQEALLRVWTKFEAYKKAIGTGLRGGDPALYISSQSQPNDQFQPLFPGDNQRGLWLTAALEAKPGALVSVVVDKSLNPTAIKHFHPQRLG